MINQQCDRDGPTEGGVRACTLTASITLRNLWLNSLVLLRFVMWPFGAMSGNL